MSKILSLLVIIKFLIYFLKIFIIKNNIPIRNLLIYKHDNKNKKKYFL